jgi:hypothetical protein
MATLGSWPSDPQLSQNGDYVMRRPVQCEGIERGPERAVQIGVVGAVQPQFLGLGDLIPDWVKTGASSIWDIVK